MTDQLKLQEIPDKEIEAIADLLLTEVRQKIQGKSLKDLLKSETQDIDPFPTEPGTGFKVGPPSDSQLEKMNLYRPVGIEPYTREEVYTVPILATHNLLHTISDGRCAWHPDVINQMGPRMVNRPHITDHDWWSVGSVLGFFYDFDFIETDTAPAAVLDAAAWGEYNRLIIENNGYQRVILHSCIQANSPAIDAIRFKRLADASTGSLHDTKYICPHDGLDFRDPKCQWIAPTSYILWLLDKGRLSDEEKAAIAAFIWKGGRFIQGVETSSVVVGNLAGTGILEQSRGL